MIATERLYPICRPLTALLAGASVALLGGLIGLGGAEFRLPLVEGSLIKGQPDKRVSARRAIWGRRPRDLIPPNTFCRVISVHSCFVGEAHV